MNPENLTRGPSDIASVERNEVDVVVVNVRVTFCTFVVKVTGTILLLPINVYTEEESLYTSKKKEVVPSVPLLETYKSNVCTPAGTIVLPDAVTSS